jgi:hypothetical protein
MESKLKVFTPFICILLEGVKPTVDNFFSLGKIISTAKLFLKENLYKKLSRGLLAIFTSNKYY